MYELKERNKNAMKQKVETLKKIVSKTSRMINSKYTNIRYTFKSIKSRFDQHHFVAHPLMSFELFCLTVEIYLEEHEFNPKLIAKKLFKGNLLINKRP